MMGSICCSARSDASTYMQVPDLDMDLIVDDNEFCQDLKHCTALKALIEIMNGSDALFVNATLQHSRFVLAIFLHLLSNHSDDSAFNQIFNSLGTDCNDKCRILHNGNSTNRSSPVFHG